MVRKGSPVQVRLRALRSVRSRAVGPDSDQRGTRSRLRRLPLARHLNEMRLALMRAWRGSARKTERSYEDQYRESADPWSYGETEYQRRRFETSLELIEGTGRVPFPTALEVGSSEGLFTEQLAPRCSSLLGTDVSETALARARERCASIEQVSFARWDALADPPPGRYDLVVCMDVVDEIDRPRARRKLVDSVIGAVAPGGSVLVTAVIVSDTVETARWARWMGLGAHWVIDRFASDPRLELRELRETERHLIARYEAVTDGG